MENKSFFRKFIEGINVIRLIIINIIFFILLIAVFQFVSSSAKLEAEKARPVKLESETVLIVNPNGVLVETKDEDEWMQKLVQKSYNTVLLSDIIKAIANAGYDRRIDSLIFDFSSLSGLSLTAVDEIEAAINEYKKSGKPFYAFSSYYSLAEYHLASKADMIWLDPFGGMDFIQFASEILFFKGMEDKFGINWNVIHAGEYKGAAEVFERRMISDNVRSNYEQMFSDFWQYFIESVSKSRKIPKANFLKFANNQLETLKETNGDVPKAALKLNLITHIGTFDEFIEKLDIRGQYNTGNKPWIDYEEFNKTVTERKSNNKICIINLDGGITSNPDAKQGSAIAGEIIQQFDSAIDDESIKAVVLRINSGGGEVGASEYIRRALENTNKKSNKPVVVSMGSVAASGAYWIASSADYIFAGPYAITGSIGVFATNPSFKKTIEDYLGINSDLVYVGQRPYSVFQEKTEEEMQIIKLQILDIYNKFLTLVSNGRKIPLTTLKPLAGGRIYSARQALKINLIDEIGTLQNALDYAAKLAGIQNDYSVTRIQEEQTFIDDIMNEISNIRFNYTDLPYLKTYLEILNLDQRANFYLYTPIKTTQFYRNKR